MSDNELEMTNKEKREMILGEFKQWNQAEQAIFLAEALKITPFSLAKFIATVCSELISNYNKLNGESHFSCIMEDQANDICEFQNPWSFGKWLGILSFFLKQSMSEVSVLQI